MAAESPAPAAPPLPLTEKRVAPENGGEEDKEEARPGPKRRRAFIAALDGVPCAAAAAEEEKDGHRDDGSSSFSFQHARGPAAPPLPLTEKRTAPENGGEKDEEEAQPGPKRRRAFMEALDGVPCVAAAAAEEKDGHRDDGSSSFSFPHARGPAAPQLPVTEKRAAPENGGEEDEEEAWPGPKRRRAFMAALDGVPCAAAAAATAEEKDGHRDDGSSPFSFQHARGGFVALETTPKFGSFNPARPAEEREALDHPKPAPSAAEDPPAGKEEEDASSPRGVGDREDGNSQLAAAAAAVSDQRDPEREHESE